MKQRTWIRISRTGTALNSRVFAALLLSAGLAACGDEEAPNNTPDTAVQDTSESDTSTSDAGGTDATEPDATEPDATEPDVSEPDTSGPDVSEPDATEPDVTEPDATEPDATEPDATEPDVTEPDTGMDAMTDVEMDVEEDPTFLVFGDEFFEGSSFAPFGGSNNNVTIDTAEATVGSASLRIEVPNGGYTGGTYVAGAPVDVSAFNAIGFWAKASEDTTFNTFGIANDGAGNAFQVERQQTAVTTEWAWYVTPIGDPSALTSIAGLFHFADAGTDTPYTLWLDDIQYLVDDTIGTPTAAFGTVETTLGVGETTSSAGHTATFPVGDASVQVFPTARHFMWMSDNEAAATVDDAGVVTTVAEGTAVITATFLGEPAGGTLTVTVDPNSGPTAAPAPTTPEAAVVASVFSDAYASVPVDTFRTVWSAADFSFEDIEGNPTLRYASLDFAGIETVGPNSLELSAATHMRFDVFSSDATAVRFKIVDFGADNAFDGGDNSEGEVTLNAGSDPAFIAGEWNQYDIPLSVFEGFGLANRANVSQFIVAASEPGAVTVYIDNVYFYTAD